MSKAACILTTQPLMRILRSREAAASVNIKTWPTIIDTGTRVLFKSEKWRNYLCLVSFYCFSHTFFCSAKSIKHFLIVATRCRSLSLNVYENDAFFI